MREEDNLKALGKKTEYKMDYAPEVLETFVNKHPDNDYWVQFNCPEFTSLCPITGQPDFAEIKILYIPGERMVESKSLKLYLFSFRNHGDFHEDCVNIIMHTAAEALVEAGGAGKNLRHCTVEQKVHTQILHAATLEALLAGL